MISRRQLLYTFATPVVSWIPTCRTAQSQNLPPCEQAFSSGNWDVRSHFAVNYVQPSQRFYNYIKAKNIETFKAKAGTLKPGKFDFELGCSFNIYDEKEDFSFGAYMPEIEAYGRVHALSTQGGIYRKAIYANKDLIFARDDREYDVGFKVRKQDDATIFEKILRTMLISEAIEIVVLYNSEYLAGIKANLDGFHACYNQLPTLIAANYENNSKQLCDEEALPTGSSSSSEECFITTAICKGLGRPDDCFELNVLRWYRDNILSSCPLGRAALDEYYFEAPHIVKRLNVIWSRNEWRILYSTYLQYSINHILHGRYGHAFFTYKKMYEFTKKVVSLM